MGKKETANEKTKPVFATDEPVGTEMEPEPKPEPEMEPKPEPPVELIEVIGSNTDIDGERTVADPTIAIHNLREHFNTHQDAHIRDIVLNYLNYLESHCHGK